MFPLKNTEAYIHANGFRSTLGKELADRDAEINALGSEIQALTNYVTDTGVKNFLDVTATTTTDHGVTFTVNADKTITVSGTADGLAAIDVSKNVPLKPDNYILSGNGATNIVWNSLTIYNGSTLVETFDLSSATGSDIPLNLASKTFDNVTLSVKRKTNGAVSGTISPMIRLASITDPTYQPYAKTNLELTQDVAEITSGSYLVKRGKLVQLAVNTWTAKFSITIPADFRPRKQMIFVIEQRKESAPTEIVFNRLTVGTDGTITLLGENDQLLGTVYWFTA